MKHWEKVVAIILVVAGCFISLYYLKIFDDPYHREGKVNVYTWLQREIIELLHGEKYGR